MQGQAKSRNCKAFNTEKVIFVLFVRSFEIANILKKNMPFSHVFKLNIHLELSAKMMKQPHQQHFLLCRCSPHCHYCLPG